jgi:hypothetical protein
VEKAGALTGGREARGIGGRGAGVEEVVVRGRPSAVGSIGVAEAGARGRATQGQTGRQAVAGRAGRMRRVGRAWLGRFNRWLQVME